jgi:serine/threonine protein kinase
MHQLRHRKLVQLLGVCTTSEPMYIITELMSNGSLLEYLRHDEGRTVTVAVVIDMSAQIADGMAYLESKNFIHRDLRAANILVSDNNTVKVADFGLARILDQSDIYDASKETKFPIKWTAPEAAYGHKFSVKSDVWSYGVLLYEMITYGRTPYPGMDGTTTLEKVQAGYRMQRPTGHAFDCPPKIYEVMLKCWDAMPANRPTFAYLLGFFDDYATESEEHYHPTQDDK